MNLATTGMAPPGLHFEMPVALASVCSDFHFMIECRDHRYQPSGYPRPRAGGLALYWWNKFRVRGSDFLQKYPRASLVGEKGMLVVDISDPAAPHQIAAIPSKNWSNAVAVSGGYAYIADALGGLRIVDVATPGNPVVVASYTRLPGDVLNVTVGGSHALVAGEESVYAFDISVPAKPLLLSAHAVNATEGIPPDIAVGNEVLVTDFDGGLRVLDAAGLDGSQTYLPFIKR
jgi:hypothetical protein